MIGVAMQSTRAGWGKWNWVTGETVWSEEGKRLMGFESDQEAATVEGWLSRIHPDDRPEVEAHVDQAAAEHRDFCTEYRVVHSDGNIIWLLGTGHIFYDENNKPVRSTGFIIDITERKKAEAALKESEQLYRTLVDNSQDSFQLIELLYDNKGNPVDFRYLQVNSAFEHMVGLKAKDIIGKTAREVFPNYDSTWLTIPQKVLETKKTQHVELFGTSINKYLDLYYFPYGKDRVGTLFRDITERKKAEAAVEQERKRFFDVLETLPIMVCLITKDYHIVFANRSVRDLFGEINGRTCYDYYHGLKEPCSFCESLKPFETGKPHHWIATNPQGIIIDVHGFPFTDTDGTQLILEFDRDITEKRKMVQQLKDSERLATIGATAGMVGHDIRNPLQAMMSDVYLLKDFLRSMPEMPMKKDVAESLDGLECNISYVNKIVADLQDYAKPLKPEPVEIDDLRKEIEGLLSTVKVPSNIEIKLDFDKSIPVLRLDATFLKRIIINLATNSIQAMPDGGKLTVRAYQKDAKLVITVEDTGIGIPEELKPKMFTPLLTTKAKGQGFGLAVVKRYTEALGGTISFESQEGKGTKFTINLPAKKN